ncbi:RDD family protein [Gymnodinialimonas hymeniacidonis]|uniref:RDD family protein n=1 Tax=Gymnodinialimonas hymeniacidonis TaxID=3126508 RepID=UPI0034C5EC89
MTNLPDPSYDAAYYDGVLPKRFFAWVIDAALIFAAMILLSIFTAGIAFVLWIPVHAVLSFFYRWTTIKNRSATFGMRVMNIELRNRDGQQLSDKEAALHTLVFLAGAMILIVQLISIAMMIGRPLNRGLADEITGAVMLNRPA